MTKNFTTKFVLFALFLFLFGNIFAQTFDRNFSDGKIYVKLKDSAKKLNSKKGVISLNDAYFIQNQVKKYAVNKVKQPFYQATDNKLTATYLIEFSQFDKIDALVAELKADANIEYVEKSPIFYTKAIPNDPFYTQANYNWHLKQIKAEEAWALTTGSADIVVAVIDDAIQTTHADLTNKIVAAFDVANNDENPNPPNVNTFSHGTHCAGLIAAETNNGIGIASIGYKVSIMAIKAAEDSNPDGISNGYEGIVYAADHGADVLSLSWGGPGSYQTLQNVVTYAYNKGCVIVAAAGNEATEGNYKSYPACYDHVISVGAVNENNSLAWFSQYGDDKVDVCAPGGVGQTNTGLISTVPYYSQIHSGNYDYKSGTSMATPITAGLCGLILSVNPNLTPDKLKDILYTTCTNISSYNSTKGTGNGLINAYEAVKKAGESVETIFADFSASPYWIYAESSINFTYTGSETATTWAWEFEGGTPATSAEKNPKIQYLTPGKYKVKLTITNATKASSTETKTEFITVLEKGFGMQQATGFTASSRGINRISIADEENVWALAYDGANTENNTFDYTRTTNGGETWQPAIFPGYGGLQFADLFALNGDTAWIAVFDNEVATTNSGGGIFRTTDGGQTWTKQTTASYSGSSAFVNTVLFFDKNNGWSMGDPNDGYFEIYTTSNGGENWTRVEQTKIPFSQTGEYGTVRLRDFYGESTAWFSTNKGRVFKTTDKGKNWTSYSSGLSSITDISFADVNNGVVSNVIYNSVSQTYTDIQMSYTTNGGATWSAPFSAKTKNFYGSTKAVKDAPGVFISVGINTSKKYGSSYSVDFGKTWFAIDNIQYTEVEFYNQDIGWAGGFNESATVGGIYKWSRIFDAISDIQTHETAGIFPNPNTGLFNIHAKTAYRGAIKTEIYNIAGKLIYSQTEDNNSETVYSTTVNLSNIERGIYIAKITAGNQIFRNKVIIE